MDSLIVGLAISVIQETNVSNSSDFSKTRRRAARERDQVDDGGLDDLHRLILHPSILTTILNTV